MLKLVPRRGDWRERGIRHQQGWWRQRLLATHPRSVVTAITHQRVMIDELTTRGAAYSVASSGGGRR